MAVALAGAATWFAMLPRSTSDREVVHFTLPLREGDQLPYEAGMPAVVAISRDGTQIAYTARVAQGTRLFLRQLGGFDSTPVAGSEGGIGPFFSPDGQWLGFASGGALRVVALAGGTARTLAEAPNFTGASWGMDGTIVFSPDWVSGLSKVPARGGPAEPLTTVNRDQGEYSHYTPLLLPGGRAVLLSVHKRNAPDEVHVVDLATGERRRLVQGHTPQYLTSGHLVVANGGTLLVVPFDLERLQLTGEPIRALDGVRQTAVAAHFAAAHNGTLVYAPAEAGRNRRLVWVTRKGRVEPAIEESHRFVHPRISPDGSRVVVWVVQETGGAEIWVYPLSTAARTRLPLRGQVSRPVWEPDGGRVTVQSAGQLVSVPAAGGGESTVVLAPDADATVLFPLAWSRTGGVLAYSRPVATTGRDIWTLQPGEPPRPFVDTLRDERSAMFSPDGRWIVYAETEAGRDEQIYVQPYPGPGDRVGISPGGGSEPVWSPTGREIFYRSLDGGHMMVVDVGTKPGFTTSGPRQLFEFEGRFRPQTGAFWSNYDVSPDGLRFLMVEDLAEVESLNVIVGGVATLLNPK
jgi:eukaryotic-like serine/threonine-protein kinase